VLLVLSPNEQDRMKLPMDRIKANFVGATVGLIFYLVGTFNLLILCLSVLTTIFISYILNYSSTTRSALAALIIVILHQEETNEWRVGFERMSSVFFGCIVAILVSYLAIIIEKWIQRLIHKNEQ